MVIFFGIILFSMPLFGKEGVDLSQIDFVANMLFFFNVFFTEKFIVDDIFINTSFFSYLLTIFCVKWHINNALQLEFFVFHNNLLYVGFLLRTLIFVFQSNVTFWLFFLKQKRVISGEVSWLFRKGWQWLLRVEF